MVRRGAASPDGSITRPVFLTQANQGIIAAMSDPSSKIITSFQDRLELDAALRRLGEPSNDTDLRRLAAGIAEKYGDKAVPALLGMLDTPNPQLRSGLGHLSTVLPEDKVVPALSAAARNRTLPSQARMAAITILERFLNVEPDESMYAGLGAPEEMALHSLRELLVEARSDRMVTLEYFSQLSLEPPDVQITMVKAARQLEGAEGVEILRVFAQDPLNPVAQEALQTLGMIADPSAAAALRSLIPTVSAEIRPQAERSLQKLRLRGVAISPPVAAPPSCRCLASPMDSQGNQVLWFVVPGDGEPTYDVLNILINVTEGMAAAAGAYGVTAESLPALHPPGTLLDLTGQPQPLWLETSFDYGRRRVLEALALNTANKQPPPLAYRLLNPMLWRWTMPAPAPAVPECPAIPPNDTPALLRHPAMGSWFAQSRQVYLTAETVLTGNEVPTPEHFAQTVRELLRSELASDDLRPATLKASLLTMGDWFAIAGDSEHAHLACAAGNTIEHDPLNHPLLLQMCEIGLRLAMMNLARGLMPDLLA